MLYTELCASLPDEPLGLEDFVKKIDVFNLNYLIYSIAYVFNPLEDRREKMIKCKCTACGEEYYEAYASKDFFDVSSCKYGFFDSDTNTPVCSHSVIRCSCCGEPVTVVSNYDFRYNQFLCKGARIGSVSVVDGTIALLSWHVKRFLHKDGKFHIDCFKLEGNAFDSNHKYAFTGSTKTMNGSYSYFLKWYQLEKYKDRIGSFNVDYFIPFDGNIFEKAQLKNCHLDKYIFEGADYENCVFPSLYMQLYQKHPSVENLVMNDASYLVNEMIDSSREQRGAYYNVYYLFNPSNVKGVNFKCFSPFKMLSLSKDDYRYLISNRFPFKWVQFYSIHKDYLSFEDLRFLMKNYSFNFLKCLNSYPDVDVLKALRYVKKQAVLLKDDCINLSFLVDYWNMLRDSNILIDSNNRYPMNLNSAHDNAVMSFSFVTDVKLKGKYARRYKELSKFVFIHNGLIIRPVASDDELYREGKILHHCVYSYAKRHCDRDTSIFFIRRIEEPSMPFYTLEFDEKNLLIRQNRGKYNNKYVPKSEVVSAFEKKWLEFVKKVMEDEKNGKSSSKSKSRVSASA